MSNRTIYLVQSITECARCAGSGTIPNMEWAEVTCPAPAAEAIAWNC